MPPIDASIPLQVQQGSPFASMTQATQALSGLANYQNAQQQNQLLQADTQVMQQQASQGAQLQSERQKYTAALQDPNSPFYNSDGTIDPNKFQVWSTQNIPLTQGAYGKELLDHTEAVNKYKTTVANMSQGDHAVVNAALSSFVRPDGTVTATPQQMGAQLDAIAPQMTGYGNSFVAQAKQAIANTANNPAALGQIINQLSRSTTPAQTQGADRRASTTFVNTGGATVPVANTGEYGQQVGAQTGAGVANTLSPGESASRVPTFQNGQPGSVSLASITPGAPGYNGGSPFGNGRMNSQPGANPSFVGNQAPMGTSEDVNWMKKDYQDVTSTASTAQQRIGLYNNVQQLSKQALTGPQDRLAYANSVLALVGVPAAQNLNDATAMLNKNAAMIQQAFGGNTDAARAVVAHMTPGSVMPDKANQEISEYGKANAQMQLFQQNYLKDASNGQNPGTYKDRKSDLSMVSDPRLWQFQNATPAKRIEMLSDMQKAGQNVQQFGALYKRANAMGAFQ